MERRRSGARRYPIKHRRHTEPHIPAVMTKKYRPQPWNVPQQCLHCGLLCSCRSNGAARSAQATFDPHTDNTPQQHGTIAQPPHHMGRTDQNHVSAWSHKGAIALGLHYSNPIRMWDQACLSFLWTWHTLKPYDPSLIARRPMHPPYSKRVIPLLGHGTWAGSWHMT